jgi:ketopantoate reductase
VAPLAAGETSGGAHQAARRCVQELLETSWVDIAEDPDVLTAAWRKLLSGAVTRLGRRHGVPTPANRAMYALRALGPPDALG